ncbi:ATP-binding cassette domain-containing protein [Sanguibacter sp. A247]|uniref:ATP-binding cassette domain-containing protein n=1 Tax=unclassified Sanguibacter TaxID=2645534 RepID=UPI003FD75794
MMRLREVTAAIDGRVVLDRIDADVREGDVVLLAGPTGTGKTTLLRTIAGLLDGAAWRTSGTVTLSGRDVLSVPARDRAHLTGYVTQDPLRGFVTAHVETELAFGLEQQGIEAASMRRRVEDTLDLLGIADLRARRLDTLSLGQAQRVALGAALVSEPSVLLLDEPTSALDPGAADDVVGAVRRLAHDVGLTVIIAEHRLERVTGVADAIWHLGGDGTLRTGGLEVLRGTPQAPPLVHLTDVAGWRELPADVRAARRAYLAEPERLVVREQRAAAPTAAPAPVRVRARGLEVRRGTHTVVPRLDLELHAGEVTVLMGRNGAGKSTLLRALAGMLPHRGRLDVEGADPARLGAADARRRVALVPQEIGALLFTASVAHECASGDADAGAEQGTTRTLLDSLVDGIADATHPRDLSEGEKLALVLAIQLAAGAHVLLLDEPTRGLDTPARHALVAALRARAAAGATVVLATHDGETAAEAADRVIVLADGEVISDGPARDVLTGSVAAAPQIARVVRPLTALTVHDLVRGPAAGPA